jgi:hypothetical protein
MLLAHKVIQAAEVIVLLQAELLVVVVVLADQEQQLLGVLAQVQPTPLVLAELDTHGLTLA